MTTRPSRLPFEEKFPEHFDVGSLPQPNRTERQLPTRPIGKKNKQAPKDGEKGQAVIETFFGNQIRPSTAPANIPPMRVDDDDEDYDAHFEGEITTLPEKFLHQHDI